MLANLLLSAVVHLLVCVVGIGWGSAWCSVFESVGFVVGSGSCNILQNPSRSCWKWASRSISMTSSEMLLVLLVLEEVGGVAGGRTGVIFAAADRLGSGRRLLGG